MQLQNSHKQLIDGLIVANASVTQSEVQLQLTDKEEAQYIYRLIKPIAESRRLEQANQTALSRDWYVKNDEQNNTDELRTERHHSQVYTVVFEPSKEVLQRASHWLERDTDDEDVITLVSPDDFELTQTAAKIIYLVAVEERINDDGRPLEFTTQAPDEAVSEALSDVGIKSESVNGLFRLRPDDAAHFREYACVSDNPTSELNNEVHPDATTN